MFINKYRIPCGQFPPVSEQSGVRHDYKSEQHNIFDLFIWVYFRNPNIITQPIIAFHLIFSKVLLCDFSCEFFVVVVFPLNIMLKYRLEKFTSG